MKAQHKEAFIGYMPVISEASLRMLDLYRRIDSIGLVNPSEIPIRALEKDFRALTPQTVVELLQPKFPQIRIVGMQAIKHTLDTYDKVFLPDDEVTKYVLENTAPKASIVLDRTFYRWNAKRALENSEIDGVSIVSRSEIPEQIQSMLELERNQSTDWWRTVSALLVDTDLKQSIILSEHNQYLPSHYSGEIDGDMRSNFTKGVAIEQANAIHAEALLVSHAAKMGIKLEGLDLHVSTFPCPVCAKLLSETGIRRLYFYEGYKLADGQEVLEESGVEIVKVISD